MCLTPGAARLHARHGFICPLSARGAAISVKLLGLTGRRPDGGVLRTGSRDEGLQLGKGKTTGGAQYGGGGWLPWEGACGDDQKALGDWTPTVWQHVQGTQGDSQNHVHAAVTERFLP